MPWNKAHFKHARQNWANQALSVASHADLLLMKQISFLAKQVLWAEQQCAAQSRNEVEKKGTWWPGSQIWLCESMNSVSVVGQLPGHLSGLELSLRNLILLIEVSYAALPQ